MALRKKRKESKSWRSWFSSTAPSKNKRQQPSWIGPSLMKILLILLVVCVLAGVVIGLEFLDRYVKTSVSEARETVNLELLNVPVWVPDQVKENVMAAATGNSPQIRIDENTALTAQRNIEKDIAWIDDVKVRTKHNGLQIEGRWRKPIARLKWGTNTYYVDIKQVVLDFVPMPQLWVVEVEGLSLSSNAPSKGQALQLDDLEAAITILDRLERMDRQFTPDKPLLYEIAGIDVGNFGGRKNSRDPHIVLHAKDGTEIIWGAEFGTWQQHLESTDEQKLAKLYGYYKGSGTLLGGAKYINLRDPKYKVPLPIDKY